MSVHTVTPSVSLSRMNASWLYWKGLISSLSLLTCTHSFVPLKDEGAERVIPSGLCATYIPEDQEMATQTASRSQRARVSPSSRALPNFCCLPSRLTPGSHCPAPPLRSHLEEATVQGHERDGEATNSLGLGIT